jgi:CheY-like chemotaxis protein
MVPQRDSDRIQQTKPLRIMIAEDEGLISLFLAELLEGLGHTVCASVATEAEAVAAAKVELPELIIMDGTLRQGSGVHAMKAILSAGFIPHIFVTGDPYRLCAEPGTIIVQKPFDSPTLVRAIKRALLSSAS